MKLVVLVAFLVGCVEEPPPSRIVAESHVFTFDHPGWLPRKLDVVFVIDDSPALAPYVDRIRALPPALVAELGTLYTGMPDLRVGVVTPSRSLTDYLTDEQHVDGTRTPNFSGTLVEAIAARLEVGIASDSPPHLFDALIGAVPSFVRANSDLFVVQISARDDSSLGAPYEYAAQTIRADSRYRTQAIGIYPPGAPRMDAFHRELNSYKLPIDADDYTSAFGFIGSPFFTYASPCIPEPALPYDCAITVTDEDGVEHVLPPAEYEIKADPINCYAPDSHRVYVRGYADPYRPAMRGQCVAR